MINFNLSEVRRRKNVSELEEKKDEMSLELVYSYMLGHYGVKIVNECPQLGMLAVSVPLVGLHP